MNRVYGKKGKNLHVCYEGSHYGPWDDPTEVDPSNEVEVTPITDGSELDTAQVGVRQGKLEEVWLLLGDYTKKKGSNARTVKVNVEPGNIGS